MVCLGPSFTCKIRKIDLIIITNKRFLVMVGGGWAKGIPELYSVNL